MGLLIEHRTITVPGQVLAQGMDYIPGDGAKREGDDIISLRVGLANVDGRAIKITPLALPYKPKVGDRIIVRVTDVMRMGWILDTFTAYSALLPLSEGSNEYIRDDANLHDYFTVNDHLIGKVTKVSPQNLIDVSLRGPGLFKLHPGRIVRVDPAKVPRIIGRQGSMVSMIKDATGCNIIVGQNGLIWLKGELDKERIAVETIKKIEDEAHTSGLTEAIQAFLQERA